ncbi:TatD family hydrolase [Patescibacteria group bacterium]|nr:TatD family hydrolase [Patescibacteria group bacterium]MBU1755128.1 TatD family hydrolase [Patescibacteria group bacterium]
MKYFDAHAHIQFPQFDEDRVELLSHMQEKGIGGIVVGVDLPSSQKAIQLAEESETLFAAVGLHPNHTDEEFDVEVYKKLGAHPTVVAIGECGLDYYRPEEPEEVKEKQKVLFRQHVDVALELDLPLIIHARPSKGTMDAYQDLIAILGEYKTKHGDRLRGDIHFFVGGKEEAAQFVMLGFTMSYTAVVTFAREYDETIRSIPLTHLVSETDAPYVAPASRRGTRNDPMAVEEVVAALAEIRGENPEIVREAMLQNASRVFGIVLPT